MTVITDNVCEICCAPAASIEPIRLGYAFLCAGCGERYGEFLLHTTGPLEDTYRALAQHTARAAVVDLG